MVTWRVYVLNKPNFTDHHGIALAKEWRHAGYSSSPKVRVGQAYEIAGNLSREEADVLARQLLADPITQQAVILPSTEKSSAPGVTTARIWPKPGVSDPVAQTVSIGAGDLGLKNIAAVRTGTIYEFAGNVSAKDIQSFCESFLMNPLVQQAEVN